MSEQPDSTTSSAYGKLKRTLHECFGGTPTTTSTASASATASADSAQPAWKLSQKDRDSVQVASKIQTLPTTAKETLQRFSAGDSTLLTNEGRSRMEETRSMLKTATSHDKMDPSPFAKYTYAEKQASTATQDLLCDVISGTNQTASHPSEPAGPQGDGGGTSAL
ncbi:hypothetical protein I317_07373 [Kwoniella heveanensis CBS 569]|uniref:Uncharacterized protein n=1 Tax=Kwoniella heveanensis BCC8398 TaxID=1296120 RepID=A0A1B9H1B8_9TREE|nr:hypothetical protein I316_00981 [Kwoniella heveanensis BCC8398]OCF38831.1 hypothetical protein I317_07373 [Kwoniella heveanensis CBS 569]